MALIKGNVSSMKKIILMTFHQNSGQSNSLFTQMIDLPPECLSVQLDLLQNYQLCIAGLNFDEFCRFSLVPQYPKNYILKTNYETVIIPSSYISN